MLDIIEREGKRVLTTAQVAEAYNIEAKSLMRNFQRNKEHFAENIHYFALTGEALKQFKGERQNDANLKYASNLYLWTEQGAFLLAKSLQSEKAWTAYNMLVGQYYNVTQQIAQVQEQPQLPYDPQRFLALEQRVQEIEAKLQEATLKANEQNALRYAVTQRVNALCAVPARRPAFFASIYREIKRRYKVGSYRDVPQCKLQDALQFVNAWKGSADV
ncbi:ORF6N domain-containing protein [Metasolibacillus sp. FSL H7-0170]|uniref:ORF6N domain-containing protein n=1 Tax=Metasolibacillus sp. FSL H7-0170 TaxID=2921431 RepID=UPI0031591F5D